MKSIAASTHAELDALRKLKKKYELDAVMYVARVNKHGVAMLSRPCDTCMEYCHNAGIKEIVYTC